MTIRANWFSGAADKEAEAEDDPFAHTANGHVPAPANGKHPDAGVHPTPPDYWTASEYTLETPLEELEARLRELLQREANLDASGITCALKERAEVACSACPISEFGKETKLAALCRLGREQERILALIHAKQMEGEGGE